MTPPPEVRNRTMMTARFVYLGFPKRIYDAFPMCCYDGSKIDMQAGSSFQCPRCKVRNTQLPTQCRVCGLQLYSSSHIARSHHHMFPVPVFLEISDKSESSAALIQNGIKRKKFNNETLEDQFIQCTGCNVKIADNSDTPSFHTACPKCQSAFCVECDIFIHDSLHNCPGCCY